MPDDMPVHRLTHAGPAGVRLYAIGDVHGRFDLLEEMFRRIDADRAAHPGRSCVEIMLGDLIDRGPDSASVIDAAIARAASHGLVALRGNHDQYLIDALADPASIPRWLVWGGIEALASWGVAVEDAGADPRAIAAALAGALPEEHRRFIAATPLTARHGGILFVHAGIRPGVPLEAQTPQDVMMIREPFHSDPRDHGVVVVHGHTPGDEPVIRANRVCVDTRAYLSGVLTCAVIEGAALSFIAVAGPPSHETH